MTIKPFGQHNYPTGALVGFGDGGEVAFQSVAMTDLLVSDTAHGDLQQFYSQSDTPLRWDIRHGSSGSPVDVGGPTMKISRYANIGNTGDAATWPGTAWSHHVALEVLAVGASTTYAQPVAGVFMARSSSTRAEVFPDRNPDANGSQHIGIITGSGVGRAIGSFNQCIMDPGVPGPSASAGEFQVANLSGTATPYNAATPHDMAVGVLISSVSRDTSAPPVPGLSAPGAAIYVMHNSASYDNFDVGIGFSSGNPVRNQTFRDDGNATTSLQIGGNHTYAMTTSSGAGKSLFGVTTMSADTRVWMEASSATGAALVARGYTSQTTNIVQVQDSANAELFAVHPTHVRATAPVFILGTAGAGYVQYPEQSSDPSAAQANTARVFSKDNGSGKTQLAVRFPSGATQILATEP